MRFTFLHTADWQIGKRFGSFPEEKRPILRHQRLQAIDRLAEAASTGGCSAVLVAGDVFDAETIPEAGVRELIEKLRAHRQLDWHLLPGNHDPARAGGVWEVVRSVGLPANVHLHLEPKAVEIAPGVLLLTAPLSAKRTEADPTAWWDGVNTAHPLRIGLAHGSVQGFGSNGDANVPINPARVKSARLSYLALGDWHGTTRISDRVWYSGTHEPDGFRDNDPGNAVVVHLDGAAPPAVDSVRTGHFNWQRREYQIDSAASLDALDAEVTALGGAASRYLYTVSLSGAVPLTELARIEQRLTQLAPRVFHLAFDMRAVAAFAAADDLAALNSPALSEVARRLKEKSEAGGGDAAVAERALRRLFALARQAEGVGGVRA